MKKCQLLTRFSVVQLSRFEKTMLQGRPVTPCRLEGRYDTGNEVEEDHIGVRVEGPRLVQQLRRHW